MSRTLIGTAVLTLAVFSQELIAGQLGSGEARASDAPLQHALKEAGCLSTGIRQVWRYGHLIAYEANCPNTSRPILTVICDPKICRVEEPDPAEEGQ